MATIGTTAPSQNTINYDALLSTTLMAYKDQLADNIFKANAFLAAMKEYGGVDYQDGGERVQAPLLYEENNTVKSYKGYEQLQVTPQDGITSAFYEWAELAGTISISRREERQNSGEARLLNLLKSKIMQAEMSLKSAVNNQLVAGTVSGTTFIPGNSGKDLLPLGYFLSKANATDPTGTGVTNVGNISRATYSFWRHRTAVCDSTTKDTGNDYALAISTWAGVALGMRRMHNFCARGADGSAPNIVLCDQLSYESYCSTLDAKMRYSDTKLADIGFDNVKLLGSTVIWDERMPNMDEGKAFDDSAYSTNDKQGTMFFINTKFMKLIIDSQTDFATTEFVEPENQTAKVAKVLFMGQLASFNQRKHGVMYALSGNIVS